jgi:hypothetical protein
MIRSRLFKCLPLVGLLLTRFLWSVFDVPALAATAQAKQAPMPIHTTQNYMVQFLGQDEVLNIHSGPGIQYPIVDTLGNRSEVQSTGAAEWVGNTLWLPIRSIYPEITGWINRLYAVQEVERELFCADARVLAIVESVRAAVRTQDAARLVQTILPERGLYIGGLYWGSNVLLSEDEVRNFFTDTAPREWGAAFYGEPIQGSLPEVIVPLMSRDLVPNNVAIACYDNQDGLMGYGVYSAGVGIDALPFYSVMRPGAPGHEFDWGAWALGIDYWEGEPTLAYLSYYFWTP